MRLKSCRHCCLPVRRCVNLLGTWILATISIALFLYLKENYGLPPDFRILPTIGPLKSRVHEKDVLKTTKATTIIKATTTDQTTKLSPPIGDCDKVDFNDKKRMLYFSYWPIFRGYADTRATDKTDPPDPLLIDRILASQEAIKTPLFRFVKNHTVSERHEWEFEKIIHQTWISEQIPGRTAPWVKKWLQQNKDWTHMFWTDKSSRLFVERYFPSLLPIYDSWNMSVQRADMFRYLVLYAFGGVYADLDMEPLRPLEEIRNWSSCILSREPDLQTAVMVDNLNCWGNNYTYTCNAFLACRSHHPFLHYVISRLVQWSPPVLRKECLLKNLLECTGPTLVSLSYGFYKRSVPESLLKEKREFDVICPEYEYFLPTFDNTRLHIVRRQCRSRRNKGRAREACIVYRSRRFKNEPLKQSFTNHHWFHSYLTNVKKNLVDIRNVTRPYMWPTERDENDFLICYR